jgi:hypothetical protein
MSSHSEENEGALIPVSHNKNPTYENFEAECPRCGRMNIFNRASDLRTFDLIMGRNVTCQYTDCAKLFRITGDLANSAWEMMIFECYDSIHRKRYMACVLGVAQAYEVFFATFLRAQLIQKPFVKDANSQLNILSRSELNTLNRLLKKLYTRTKKLTFKPMRDLLLQCVINGTAPQNLNEAEAAIDGLPAKPITPKDDDIAGIKDAKLADYLQKLKDVDVNELRNQIVHKDAYRPSREISEEKHKEARSLLFWLKVRFNINDDLVWYVATYNKSDRPASGDNAAKTP